MTTSSDLTIGTAVDWRFAATVGQRLVRPGPPSSDYTRRQAMEELTSAAAKAEPPVRDVTGLVTSDVVPPARIVDRPDTVTLAVTDSGPVRGVVTVVARYTWPERVDEHTRARTGEVSTEVTVTNPTRGSLRPSAIVVERTSRIASLTFRRRRPIRSPP